MDYSSIDSSSIASSSSSYYFSGPTPTQRSTVEMTEVIDQNEAWIQRKLNEKGQGEAYFPFTKLPIEIRNMIYRFALVIDRAIDPVLRNETRTALAIRRQTGNRGSKWAQGRNRNPDDIPESVLVLLEVSRMVHDEAMQFFYGENMFSFSDTTRMFRFLHSIGMGRRRFIGRISISFSQKANANAKYAFLLLADDAERLKFLYIRLPYTPMSTFCKFDWVVAMRGIRGLQIVEFDVILGGNPEEFKWIEDVRDRFSSGMLQLRVPASGSQILSGGPILQRMRQDLVRAQRLLDDKRNADASKQAKAAGTPKKQAGKPGTPTARGKRRVASETPTKTRSRNRRNRRTENGDEDTYDGVAKKIEESDYDEETEEDPADDDFLPPPSQRTNGRRRVRRTIVSSDDED